MNTAHEYLTKSQKSEIERLLKDYGIFAISRISTELGLTREYVQSYVKLLVIQDAKEAQ